VIYTVEDGILRSNVRYRGAFASYVIVAVYVFPISTREGAEREFTLSRDAGGSVGVTGL
jgi:hypothetical protein